MKLIKFEGLDGCYPEAIDGTDEWFACMMFAGGACELYEAEEIKKLCGTFPGSTCVLIHYPDGGVLRPFALEENIFVAKPVYDSGVLYFLVVDFECETITIYSLSELGGDISKVTELPRGCVPDLYNLMLKTTPVTLIRNGADDDFNVVYPENISFRIGERESMCFRDGAGLYFSEWWEDDNDDYHERVIVRDCATGEVVEKFDGTVIRMVNGDIWVT